MDLDGEVATSPPDNPGASSSLGWLKGVGSVQRNKDRFPFFVPNRAYTHGIIGYAFDRFEYEVYRAKILAEERARHGSLCNS